MRAIKAVILLILIAVVGWALVNLAQMMLAAYPSWVLWHVGAAIACVYVLADALDRSREWFGYRGEYRVRRPAMWRRWG